MGQGSRDPDLRTRSYLETLGLGFRMVTWPDIEVEPRIPGGCQFSQDATQFAVRLVHTADMRAWMGRPYGVGEMAVVVVVVVLGSA